MTAFIKPTAGAISSAFGLRRSPGGIGSTNHLGTDIHCAVGSEVVASADGKVTTAGLLGGFGGLVIVDHGQWRKTYYAHLSEILVTVGQHVTRGQLVARSGGARGSWGAGSSTGPHLHTEHRYQGVPLDPEPFWAAPASAAHSPITEEDDMPKPIYYAPSNTSSSNVFKYGQHVDNGLLMAGVYAQIEPGGPLRSLTAAEWTVRYEGDEKARAVTTLNGNSVEIIAAAAR